jgi:hypothetical protein
VPGGAARPAALRAGGAARLAAALRACLPALRAQNAQKSAFGTFLTSQSAFGTQKMKFEKIDFLPFLRFSKFLDVTISHRFAPFSIILHREIVQNGAGSFF